MIRIGTKLSRAAAKVAPATFSLYKPSFLSQFLQPTRLFSANEGFKPNPVTRQMINYALTLARSQKSDESYAQGLLVLEQCQSTQQDDNSKGLVLLGRSTLFSERGNFEEAIEQLKKIQELSVSSLAIKVAATEALVGLHLELGQDDTSSVLADVCLQLLEAVKLEIGSGYGDGILDARAKALKGLVELVRGDLESSESYFQGIKENKGSVALSYGGFLHTKRNFPLAKEFYEKVIQGVSETEDLGDPYNLAAGNMVREEVLLAATCLLGQLEAHVGNFVEAEEMLTRALTKTAERFGSRHPKVGVVLTCIALMFGHKATIERSSSIMIQEGLYRSALEKLNAPPMETSGMACDMVVPNSLLYKRSNSCLFKSTDVERMVHRRDMVALARGGYAELLRVQQDRKAEGERMKKWAETAWGNRRLSLADAVNIIDSSSKVPVIDIRISRVL